MTDKAPGPVVVPNGAVKTLADTFETKIQSADDVFNMDDRDVIFVPVAPWKGRVGIRLLTAFEAIQYVKLNRDREKSDDAIIWVVQRTTVKPDGTRLFDDSVETFKKLGERSLKAIKIIERAALIHNGLASEEAIQRAQAEAEAEAIKNASGAARMSDSPTG